MKSNIDSELLQVRAALNPRVMAGYLAEALGMAGFHQACRILNVKYEPGEYCTILYSLGKQPLVGSLRWDGAVRDGVPETARLIAPLGMLVYRLEHDPALPGLEVALKPELIAGVLAEELPELRDSTLRALRCKPTVLRYRPGRRCTLRLDLWLRDVRSGAITTRTLFGKAYHDLAKATAVYDEMLMLAGSAPVRDGRLLVARPVAFLRDLRIVLQEPVEGTPLDGLLEGMARTPTASDPRGCEGVIRSAPALAALHTAGLATYRQRPIADELRRFKKRAAQAEQVEPVIGARMGILAATLPDWLDLLPEWGEELGLVHGDCKPSQFLVGPAGVAMLDFDHCGMADPATDVGTYLATLRQLGAWQSLDRRRAAGAAARARRMRALEELFLEGYCTASARRPEFRLRAIWYEAVALLRKALRAFARNPRSAMPALLVEEAWRCLDDL